MTSATAFRAKKSKSESLSRKLIRELGFNPLETNYKKETKRLSWLARDPITGARVLFASALNNKGLVKEVSFWGPGADGDIDTSEDNLYIAFDIANPSIFFTAETSRLLSALPSAPLPEDLQSMANSIGQINGVGYGKYSTYVQLGEKNYAFGSAYKEFAQNKKKWTNLTNSMLIRSGQKVIDRSYDAGTRNLSFFCRDKLTGATTLTTTFLNEKGVAEKVKFLHPGLDGDFAKESDNLYARLDIAKPNAFFRYASKAYKGLPSPTVENMEQFAKVLDGIPGVANGGYSTYVSIGNEYIYA